MCECMNERYRINSVLSQTSNQSDVFIHSFSLYKLNPAELATKQFPNPTSTMTQWIEGPEFIRQGIEHWPGNIELTPLDHTTEIAKVLTVKSVIPRTTRLEADPCRVGNWLKLVRVTAWSMRMTKHLMKKTGPADPTGNQICRV